jgi:hypothetical protein
LQSIWQDFWSHIYYLQYYVAALTAIKRAVCHIAHPALSRFVRSSAFTGEISGSSASTAVYTPRIIDWANQELIPISGISENRRCKSYYRL